MRKFKVYVNGQPFEVLVEETGGQTPSYSPAFVTPQAPAQIQAFPSTARQQAPIAHQQAPASAPPAPSAAPAPPKERPVPKPKPTVKVEGGGAVTAPMPGSILDVKVKVGDSVNEGDLLLVLEAMKMENEVSAPASGKIKSINVEKGSTVNTGDLLMVIE